MAASQQESQVRERKLNQYSCLARWWKIIIRREVASKKEKEERQRETVTTEVYFYCGALLPGHEWGPHCTTSCTNATQNKMISAWNHQYLSISWAVTVPGLYAKCQNRQHLFMLLRVYSIFPSSFPALSVAFWVQLFCPCLYGIWTSKKISNSLRLSKAPEVLVRISHLPSSGSSGDSCTHFWGKNRCFQTCF